jgi:hypothetical protein
MGPPSPYWLKRRFFACTARVHERHGQRGVARTQKTDFAKMSSKNKILYEHLKDTIRYLRKAFRTSAIAR